MAESSASPEVLTLKERVWQSFDDPQSSRPAWVMSIVIIVVILVSTAAFILETEVCYVDPCVGFLPFEPWAMMFYVIEWVSTLTFTVESCIRVLSCPSLKAFFCSAVNLIDIAAWLPFWISGGLQSTPFAAPSQADLAASGGGAGFLRAIRLLRVFRVIKMGKYSLGLRLFAGALMLSLQPLIVLLLCLALGVVIFASLIQLIERPQSSLVTDELLAITGRNRDGMQAWCYGTIPSAFWWVLTTMTTVGYGDCYPITFPGKLVAVVCMLVGVIVLALPITILGSNYQNAAGMYEEDAEETARAAMLKDGKVDEYELRGFLQRSRDSGKIRPGMDSSVKAILHKYATRDGTIPLTVWDSQLKEALVNDEADMAHVSIEVQALLRSTEQQEERRIAHEKHVDRRFAALESKLDALCDALLQGGRCTSFAPHSDMGGALASGGDGGGLGGRGDTRLPAGPPSALPSSAMAGAVASATAGGTGPQAAKQHVSSRNSCTKLPAPSASDVMPPSAHLAESITGELAA